MRKIWTDALEGLRGRFVELGGAVLCGLEGRLSFCSAEMCALMDFLDGCEEFGILIKGFL